MSMVLSSRSRRSPAGMLAIALFVAFKVMTLVTLWDAFRIPQSGLLVHMHRFGTQHVFASLPEAAAEVNESDIARLVAVNGWELPRGGDLFLFALDDHLDHDEGAQNRFLVERSSGAMETLVLENRRSSLREYLMLYPHALAFDLVGWCYALLGLFVWWKRPADGASTPLLYLALVAGAHLSIGISHDGFSRVLEGARQALTPVYAPALMLFTLRFTGYHRRRWAQCWLLIASGFAGGLLCAFPLGAMVQRDATWERASDVATGVLMLSTLLAVVALSVRASQPPNPLGLRRRARVLGAATLLSFALPSLGFIPPITIHWAVSCCCLLVFPTLMSYAIIRLGAFDLRLVIGQGLLYVLLSVSVLLGYLALAYVGVKWLGQGELRALPMGIAMAAFVGVLSLGQLRIQGAINRLVFRGRYVYADALAAASEHLALARRRGEIIRTAEGALMGAMQLCRAALCTVDKDGKITCVSLGNRPDPLTSVQPPDLPTLFAPTDLAPVQRVWSTRDQASAHDSQVTAQQTTADASLNRAPDSEAGFWPHYGMEWIVPLQLGRSPGPGQISGLLLLGPKRDGRPFDREDRKLIVTLANQLAVALDNAMAFEEIEHLKQDLETQVERRTQELSRALVELERTQGQLIEQAKQVTLGRLVAGIVHEVNSPLGALRSGADTTVRLLGRVQMFVDEAAAAGDRQAAGLKSAAQTAPQLRQVLLQSSERIDRLMGSLKRFVGLDEAIVRDYDVREGIECALILLAPRLGGDIRVHSSFATKVPTVACRPSRLNQVFLNLIDNAARSLDGAGDIHLEVRVSSDHVEVAVRDSGCGMDEDTVAGLFEYGFGHRAGRVGMRLSLPTNRAMVEELGGEIEVRSRKGEGTQVTVRLPIAAGPRALAAHPS